MDGESAVVNVPDGDSTIVGVPHGDSTIVGVPDGGSVVVTLNLGFVTTRGRPKEPTLISAPTNTSVPQHALTSKPAYTSVSEPMLTSTQPKRCSRIHAYFYPNLQKRPTTYIHFIVYAHNIKS
ncbi:hypothetical protein PoB_003901000 [Plakobranchus ocellatus]|uniref:DUF4774 domain-containing protein n=1 Tax=Plakobranchus ocellatus TaxID=259542 RepID=A0AAV4AVV6_9GAST|nr:hypothetical protein PoB_003901000 [Plakobranchus ocellatus]